MWIIKRKMQYLNYNFYGAYLVRFQAARLTPPLSDGVFDTFLDIWRHDVVERVVTCVWCSSATLDSVSGNADHGAAT